MDASYLLEKNQIIGNLYIDGTPVDSTKLIVWNDEKVTSTGSVGFGLPFPFCLFFKKEKVSCEKKSRVKKIKSVSCGKEKLEKLFQGKFNNCVLNAGFGTLISGQMQ